MATLIEPCPFCNSGHLHIAHHLVSHSVVCQNCKSKGPQRRVLEEAVLDWNHTSRVLRSIQREKVRPAHFKPQQSAAANSERLIN